MYKRQLVPQPIVKASAVLRLDNVEYFTVGADGRSRALGIQVPFAKIGGVVTGIMQHMGDSLLLRRQAFIMPRRAVAVSYTHLDVYKRQASPCSQ